MCGGGGGWEVRPQDMEGHMNSSHEYSPGVDRVARHATACTRTQHALDAAIGKLTSLLGRHEIMVKE